MNSQRKSTKSRIVVIALLAAIGCLLFASTAMGVNTKTPYQEMRTVFMIGDIADGSSTTLPLQAYIIFGNQLILAETWYVPTRLGGAVGLAVDETNEYLFMSFEEYIPSSDDDDDTWDGTGQEEPDGYSGPKIVSDTIDVYDARTANFIDYIQLPGTNDLAGMVVHQAREHLYVVDRNERYVYVFDTANNFQNVDYWYLTSGVGAWGIDILGDVLYVTDPNTLSNDLYWYDIDTHAQLGHKALPKKATAIAVMDDKDNPSNGPLVYTTSFDGGCLLDACNFLQRYAIGSNTTTYWGIGDDGKGISLNPMQDLVYVVQGSPLWPWDPSPRLKVVEAGTGTVLNSYQLNHSWHPTDLLATAIPFGGTVSKTCTSHPTGTFESGDTVVFEIEIENRSLNNLVFIPLADVYDTSHLTFVSSNPAPVDPTNDGQLDWTDLTVSFGMDLPPSQKFTVTVTFQAVTSCQGINDGVNLAQVLGAYDSVGVQMYAAGVYDYTLECGCQSNADCDNGVFCDGQETCDGNGECQSGSDPCSDDGNFCNGAEFCDEGTESCDHTGNPCPLDDGLFCNGDETESCNSTLDECNHTGNPCNSITEECNETTDTCDHPGDDDDTGGDDDDTGGDDDDTGGDDDDTSDDDDDTGSGDPFPNAGDEEEDEESSSCCGC